MTQRSAVEEQSIAGGVAVILDELSGLSAAIDGDAAARIVEELGSARRIFLLGQGRSGLVLRMAAMRLMHLGRVAHVIGEATAPAIAAGDVLIAASGSGTTSTVVRGAEKAVAVGASVVAITAAGRSPLARIATATLLIPAAVKTDHGGSVSTQYSGSLFEQSLLVVTDALFATLWSIDGSPAEELWTRHANLE